MRKLSTTNRAFTLIELLTVIAIIGVLVALLFPAIKTAMLKAETSKAQAAISSSLATAFKSYYTEYGRWPIAYGIPNPPYEDFIVDHNLIALLSGQDPNTFLPIANPLVLCDTTQNGLTYAPSPSGGAVQGNPHHIVFLEFKQADIKSGLIDPLGYFSDPWGKPYHFRLDVNYATQVNNPFITVATTMTTGFLIWSVGPDGVYDQNDVVLTVSPLTVTSSSKNKDNVKSW